MARSSSLSRYLLEQHERVTAPSRNVEMELNVFPEHAGIGGGREDDAGAL
jgi:hypothetical protein